MGKIKLFSSDLEQPNSLVLQIIFLHSKMAGNFFAGLGQTIAGGIATAATLGLNDDVKKWTEQGASKVSKNAEKTLAISGITAGVGDSALVKYASRGVVGESLKEIGATLNGGGGVKR